MSYFNQMRVRTSLTHNRIVQFEKLQ